MLLRLGRKYQHLGSGGTCACHSPQAQQLLARIDRGMSRRSVLKGVAASLAAPALGLVSPAFAQTAGKPILLRNVNIFDGTDGKLVQGRNVLVEGKLIKALVPSADAVADADILDCGGRTLMPGMIDAHWHSILAGIPQMVAMTADVPYVHLVAAQEAERTVLRGFTTVRDVGGPSFALKRAIDEGRIAGPRIYPSGAMISQTSGHGDFRMRTDLPRTAQSDLSVAEQAGISAIADGEAEVLRRVREQLMLGASQIKIMGGGGVASVYDPIDALQYTEAEMKAAVAAATDWGTYVCIHAYTSAAVQRALACGVKSIEHGQLADEETVKRMADADAWWSIQPFLTDEDANPKSSPEQRAQQQMIAEGTARAVELGRKHKVRMALGTDILERSFDVLRPFGRLINIGEAAGEPDFPVRKILYRRSTSMAGFELMHAVPGSRQWLRGVRHVVSALAEGRFYMPIAAEFELEDVAQAQAFLESRRSVGKVILRVAGDTPFRAGM